MAKFIPTGWQMSPKGTEVFNREYPKISQLVKNRARKYRLPSMSTEDLAQEGMLAAAYAVDTFDPERGKPLNTYVRRVVDNALKMIVCESLALCRSAFVYMFDDGEWRRVPAQPSDATDNIPDTFERTDDQMVKVREDARQAYHRERKLRALASRCSEDAKAVLSLRISAPPELRIASRNLSGGTRAVPHSRAVAHYMGWPRERVQVALRELREVLKAEGLEAAL